MNIKLLTITIILFQVCCASASLPHQAAAASSSSVVTASPTVNTATDWLEKKLEVDAIAAHIKRQQLEQRARNQGYASYAAQQEEEEKARRQRQDARLAYLESESTAEEMIRINNFHTRAERRAQQRMRHSFDGGDFSNPSTLFFDSRAFCQALGRLQHLNQAKQEEIWIQQEAEKRYQQNKLNQPKYEQQKEAMLQEFRQKTAKSSTVRFKYGTRKGNS